MDLVAPSSLLVPAPINDIGLRSSKDNASFNTTSTKEAKPAAVGASGLSRHGVARHSTMRKLLKHKTVGVLGGIALLVNSMAGPGLPQAAGMYQQNGWLYPTVAFLLYAILTALCSMFVIEAMQSIPGNKHFQGTVEYGTLINFYFSDNFSHILGQLFLYCSLQSTSIASIVTASQTFDSILIDIFHRTCGLSFRSGWVCVSQTTSANSPFGDELMVFTGGFLVVLLLVIPLSRMNLDDNINFQIWGFIATLVIYAIWIINSIVLGMSSSNGLPAAEASPSLGAVTGIVMLNYAVAATIPSWVNVKRRQVNVSGSVWSSVLISLFSYIALGVLPALALDLSNGNLLTAMASKGMLGRVTGYMFSIVVLVFSIPVFFFVSKANLVQNDLARPSVATIFSHVLPWIISIFFQTGTTINTFIAFTSLIFVSIANFAIPLAIYLKCLRFRVSYNTARQLTPRQRNLLKKIHIASKAINRFLDIAQQEIENKQRVNPSHLALPLSASSGTATPDHVDTPIFTINSPAEKPISLLRETLPPPAKVLSQESTPRLASFELERGGSFHTGSFQTGTLQNTANRRKVLILDNSPASGSPMKASPLRIESRLSNDIVPDISPSTPSQGRLRPALIAPTSPSRPASLLDASAMVTEPLDENDADDVRLAAIDLLIDEDVPDPENERKAMTIARSLHRPSHDMTYSPESMDEMPPPPTLARRLSKLIRPISHRFSSHDREQSLQSQPSHQRDTSQHPQSIAQQSFDLPTMSRSIKSQDGLGITTVESRTRENSNSPTRLYTSKQLGTVAETSSLKERETATSASIASASLGSSFDLLRDGSRQNSNWVDSKATNSTTNLFGTPATSTNAPLGIIVQSPTPVPSYPTNANIYLSVTPTPSAGKPSSEFSIASRPSSSHMSRSNSGFPGDHSVQHHTRTLPM
ncbi:hypothetical protein SmJEL517_g00758 [Synchytrium microbalum]|uniref:Amino acid transporter transmembrane domain-containing protein n=1 Tax=Synchytrium microbalum TaxID=1806994 RepID=A0A507CHS9_9FUNG|nr:uncharacterized protein SmJEL517_g00758 [Synchytrium microbalum]TPX37614.1 hypothetical protein SmJEL517_g00758 [Synchytrium microbalum]